MEAGRDIDAPAPLVEDVKLWLPSDVPAHHKATIAADSLYEGELRLHQEILDLFLQRQHLGDGVQAAAGKYRQAQGALVALGGEEKCGDFRVLLDEDLVLSEEVEADAVAMKQLSRLGRRDSRRGKMMSWIWTAMGGPDAETETLHESVRIEWAKACVHKFRWEEEVQCLREEMWRTLWSLDKVQSDWRDRSKSSGEFSQHNQVFV
ncbi:uncharacterized protein ARMOST_22422 [Armillaria ostoyae]|uniref:Uncharacterized protein n=1 Tax=Armillaria ostoyae TaxID=47428 RepID=A0A284SCU0_ARMOS|nr:uncharacterized protein ARMOST_22422 [Armillaria ostoyae]